MKRISLIVTLVLALSFVIVLCACGRHNEERFRTPTLSFSPPGEIANAIITGLQAELIISGVGTYPMTVNPDNSASCYITAIPEGSHKFTITYFVMEAPTKVILAQGSSDVTIVAGQNSNVLISTFDMSMDDDGDGVSNVLEIINGTDPEKSDQPNWLSAPSDIVITGGSVYNQTNGTAQLADTGQTLTCSSNGTSCGFTTTVSGSGSSPRNCNLNFTAPIPAGTCNLRIMATDNGTPALSIGQTISITIRNHAPTWQTAPSNITITSGSTYNQTDGAATDIDTGQTLACSGNGTSCGFAIIVNGSGLPANCNISFTAISPTQICSLRVNVVDNDSPAMSVGQTISITIVGNLMPTWSIVPSNIMITGGSVYNQNSGVATDVDTGQILTCSGVTTCGFTVTVNGSGLPANCNINFTAPVPAGTCNLRIAATDNGSPAMSVGSLISITIRNHVPTWLTTPSNITITIGSTYNQTNGVATDLDTTQTLTCSSKGTSCGFAIAVTGSGIPPRNCNVSFTAPSSPQACDLRVMAADNGSPFLTVGQTIIINLPSAVPFVSISAGCFNMGDSSDACSYSADECPVHNVCLSAFQINRHIVTVGEYKTCVTAGVCTVPASLASYTRAQYYNEPSGAYNNYPVIFVNWNQASAYCSWVGGRLPTEAEFEYAARGGLSGKRYPWGDTISCANANYGRYSSGYPCYNYGGLANDTSPVEYYAANGYGLYDMAGNVNEWVNDWYSDTYYSVSPTNNPPGPTSGTVRVLRGSDWAYSLTLDMRVSNRDYDDPAFGDYSIVGFRCAQTP